MSAIAEDDENQIIHVLFALYNSVDALDFTGPLEVLHTAQHFKDDSSSKAFEFTFAGPEQTVLARQGCVFQTQIDYKEAHERLKEFDVVVVPGGKTDEILNAQAEPIPLIKAFAELQTKDFTKERTLLSICTGSLLLAQAGVLQGLAATTHPDSYIKLENIAQAASAMVSSDRTDVMEERYVVNNARFDLGDIDENPFVVTKEELVQSRKERRRSSIARKGSNAWKRSNSQRDPIERRGSMRLGGLRVITSGAVTSGLDASLYLVCAMVSEESAHEVARVLGINWAKGVTVRAIDV